MYSDDDLESAVAAGVLSPDTAAAFRSYIARSHATYVVDEEHFRLITSFNDVFVVIASTLLLTAVAWISGMKAPWLGGAVVAATAWGLAEFFTRKRRMALPSILLLLAFVGGVFVAMLRLATNNVMGSRPDGSLVAVAAAIAAGAAWLHWQRFRVPITVAAGAAAIVVVAIGLLLSITPQVKDWLNAIMFVAGLLVFTFAMRWDMTDPARQTRQSDVAFWLHLLAAPLIVHPVFALLGLLEGRASITQAVIVILLYVVMGIAALVVDRRALMVSALFYVLYAFSELLKQFGAVSLNVALTALFIGSALLLLSAFWHPSRTFVVRNFPASWQSKLPPLK